MSDQNQGPKSILAQVQGELRQQMLKVLKSDLKVLLQDYAAAETTIKEAYAVRDEIEAKIVKVLETSGETAEGITELLKT